MDDHSPLSKRGISGYPILFIPCAAGAERMSNVLPLQAPLSGLDDEAWEDLLNYIEERRVIPIVGPELLKVETEAGPRLLYDWMAEKLAAKLAVDVTRLPEPYTLNDVVCWYLSTKDRREDTYTRMRSILRDATFAPPPALRKLAQITDFDLFVTTTFDSLLEQAINAVRFDGATTTEVIAYAPNRVVDLPAEREELQRPVVYHLMGRCSASPTYVLSDEDTLEFVCAMQSEHLTPEKLFHELEHNHLLIIGSSFSNWLARLFLRIAKRRRLSAPRVYDGAEQFVDELHRRWAARHKVPAASDAAVRRFLPPEREMPDKAVFVSYAREDLPAARQLKAGLDAAGIRTWFDLDRLEGGDDYDRKIQRNVARCSYFIPIVSATTERRLEGYFRREWGYAIDRARNMTEGAIFILPVCIDDTDLALAPVPDKFRALHFTH